MSGQRYAVSDSRDLVIGIWSLGFGIFSLDLGFDSMLIFYNIGIHIVAIVLSPILLVLFGLNRCGLRQRLGFWGKRTPVPDGRVVWCHAASMGEITALAPIARDIMEMCPDTSIAVTTTSATGLARARELMPFASLINLAPLDFPWAIRRVLKFLQPTSLILIETELWPNMIITARRRGCHVALINGRMSDSSARGYRLARGFFSSLLGKLDLLCIQTDADRERFAAFGVDQKMMATLGNLKYDLLYFLARQHGPKPRRSSFGITPETKVIVAGSTRPGEEAIWLAAFPRIAAETDKVILILAPRHLDRIGQIEHLLAEAGLTCRKRSEMDGSSVFDSGIILLDTMGELLQVYSLADVAFVGGTLAPFGGHNLLEPAMWSVPVLFGPYQDNVHDIASLLLQEGGGIEVRDDDDIVRTVLHLLRNPDVRRSQGQAAYRIIEAKAGVSKKTVRLLQERGIL